MASLDNLPIEILHMIPSEDLRPSDLASLILTNRRLCYAFSSVLYKSFGFPLAINFAVEHNRPEILRLADVHGFDVHYDEEYPLREASSLGHVDVATWLLDHGAQIDPSVVHGGFPHGGLADRHKSPLYLAIKNRHEDVALLLLSRGANPRFLFHYFSEIPPYHPAIRNCLEDTALHHATGWGALRVVEFLVKENIIPIGEGDWSRNTALHTSIFTRNFDAFDKLVELGADVEARGAKGRTPLALARERSYVEFIPKLLAAGAKDHESEN